MTARAQTVTILFTDLVGSTELLQRAGDEQAQHIFNAHHRLLREAVEAHGGHEVKWLGDGLMVAFTSTIDAVNCAIAMQQSARRPTAGERLEIRAGLNVGEVTVDNGDYFGTPVVIARRLCDRAEGGQILASDMIIRLIDGRGAVIEVKELGSLELKGISTAIPAVEIVYQNDPMALLRKLPFVGRQGEYETLKNKLAEAQRGRGSVVLLAGEPGIGKTRLTEEFCEHASSGAMVIRGNCYEGDGAAPFGPWLEALRSLMQQLPEADLRAVLGPGAADIAVVLPEIRRRLRDAEEAPRLGPESERARLFDGIAGFLRNAAQQKPLVIFVDDLHWCDRPSLALIEQVARGIGDRPIVIVGTYRDVEVDRVHPLAQTLAALRRMEHYERLTISGFTEDAVYELLTVIEPSPEAETARRALATALRAGAEGNPLFIREVLNSLVETAKLVQQDGVWTGIVTSVEELGIPEGVKEVIGRRLLRLGEGCNRVLQRASAMTSGFTWDELRSICDEPEEQLLDALDEAVGSQIIEERGRVTYAFTHALIRATLYHELSPPRRARLHRQIAERLEALYASDLDPHLGELAAHYLASMGDAAQKAIEYSIRAGDRAKELFAWEEAAGHFERALQAMDLTKTTDDRRRVDLLMQLGLAHGSTGDYTAAQNAYERAAFVARSAGLMEEQARAAAQYAEWAALLDDPARPVALLEGALADLPEGDSSARALVMAYLAVVQYYTAPREPVIELARAAVGVARRINDSETLSRVLSSAHYALDGPERVEERIAIVDEMLALASARGDRLAADNALRYRRTDLVELGDLDGAQRDIEANLAFAKEARLAGPLWSASYALAMRPMLEGRFEEAERLMQEALALGAGVSSDGPIVMFGAQLVGLRYLQGRLAEVEPLIRAQANQHPNLVAYRCSLAFIHAEIDNVDEARGEFETLAREGFGTIPREANWLISIYLLIEACDFLSDSARAETLYDLLLPYAGRNIVTGNPAFCSGSASRPLGMMASLMASHDDAQRHFEDALAFDQNMNARPWVAHDQYHYAKMLLARAGPGDQARALGLLQEALTTAEQLGMGKIVERTRAFMQEVRGQSSTSIYTSIDAIARPVEHELPEITARPARDGT